MAGAMDDWDVVVVGGGAAGCVLAARLRESRERVLLLEAGPDLRRDLPDDVRSGFAPITSHDWGWTAKFHRGGPQRPAPRGRLLGGCSSTNATVALRGHPGDYDAWGTNGATGWSYDDVLPYFRRLETDSDFGADPWHGADGPLPLRRYRMEELTAVSASSYAALVDHGLPVAEDANAPGAVGVSRVPLNTRDGLRVSTALAYLPGPGGFNGPTVRANTEVSHVLTRDGAAIGVRLVGGQELRANLVIVAAGTYASPALLLRSGIGPAAHLRALGIDVIADLPGVGGNLADHPAVSVDLTCPASLTPVPVHQIAATLHSESADRAAPPDLQFLPCGPFDANGGLMAFVIALLKPRSRGTVRLRSPDPAQPPDIQLAYFDERSDLDRLVEGVKQARDIARRPALVALTRGTELAPGAPIAKDDRSLREWVRAQAWTYHHPVGTCAMGLAPDAGAVVDPTCRVFGVDGLLVADASVMPDIPSANTHVPTVMIAEKVAASLR